VRSSGVLIVSLRPRFIWDLDACKRKFSIRETTSLMPILPCSIIWDCWSPKLQSHQRPSKAIGQVAPDQCGKQTIFHVSILLIISMNSWRGIILLPNDYSRFWCRLSETLIGLQMGADIWLGPNPNLGIWSSTRHLCYRESLVFALSWGHGAVCRRWLIASDKRTDDMQAKPTSLP